MTLSDPRRWQKEKQIIFSPTPHQKNPLLFLWQQHAYIRLVTAKIFYPSNPQHSMYPYSVTTDTVEIILYNWNSSSCGFYRSWKGRVVWWMNFAIFFDFKKSIFVFELLSKNRKMGADIEQKEYLYTMLAVPFSLQLIILIPGPSIVMHRPELPGALFLKWKD